MTPQYHNRKGPNNPQLAVEQKYDQREYSGLELEETG